MSGEGFIDDFWCTIPEKLLGHLAEKKIVPKAPAVRSPYLQAALTPVCGDIGIAIENDPDLPALSAARDSVERMMERR